MLLNIVCATVALQTGIVILGKYKRGVEISGLRIAFFALAVALLIFC